MAEGDVYQIDIRGNADELKAAAQESVKELNAIGSAAKQQERRMERLERFNKSSARWAREQRVEAFRQLSVEEKITRLKERQALVNARLVRSQGNAFRMAALGARSNQIGAELAGLQGVGGGGVARGGRYFGEGGIARLAMRGAGFAGAERLGALGRLGSLLPPQLMIPIAVAGAAGLNLFGQSNRALEIQKGARSAGIGVQNYQALSYATNQTGVDMSGLLKDWKNSGMGLQEFLQKTKPALAEMTEQFKAMGLALSPDKIAALSKFREEVDLMLAQLKAKLYKLAGNVAYGTSKGYYAGKVATGAVQVVSDAAEDTLKDASEWVLDKTVGKLFPGLKKHYKMGRKAQDSMLGIEGDWQSLWGETDPAEANKKRLQNLLEKKQEEKKAYEEALRELNKKAPKEFKEDANLWSREKERLGYAGSSSGHGDWAKNGWFASSAQASQVIESINLQKRMVAALEEIRTKMRANSANTNQFFG